MNALLNAAVLTAWAAILPRVSAACLWSFGMRSANTATTEPDRGWPREAVPWGTAWAVC